jgi:hypothetical protein
MGVMVPFLQGRREALSSVVEGMMGDATTGGMR